jgi:putative transposase
MRFDFNRPARRSIRLKGYDYADVGNYFITICTMNRECLLGKINEGRMMLSAAGKIANLEWLNTPKVRPGIELGSFVIMPNHLHGIITIYSRRDDPAGRSERSTVESNQIIQGVPPERPYMPPGNLQGFERETKDRAFQWNTPNLKPDTIGAIIGQFKSISTKKIRETECIGFHWQRNYYEHIICDRSELEKIRKYILENPENWSKDEDNPANF